MIEDAPPAPAAPEAPNEGPAFPTLEEIAVLLPQYEFHDILGIGGMGAVYLARHPALDRWVAIKLLPEAAAQNEEDAARFIAEARSMAKLTHAHIAAIHDFGQTPQGQLYLVMEHVNGLSLHQIIHGEGGLDPIGARTLTAQLCDALEYAHSHGVIHRDIKPANILVTQDWQAKIIDFGLAQDKQAAGDAEYGTPDYVAPERLQPGATVDHRADIYSLGVVIHEMHTKLTPQAAGAAAGQGLPPEYASTVSRCMREDPAQRFQHCREIKSFLAAAANIPAPSAASPAPPVQRPVPPQLQARVRKPAGLPAHHTQSSGIPGWVWAAACVLLLAGGGWFIKQQSSQAGAGEEVAAAPATAAEAAAPQETALPATTPAAPMVADAPPGPYKPGQGGFSPLKRLKGHSEIVYACGILPDQRHAVSGGHDDTLKLWDVATGAEVKSFPSPVGDVHGLKVASDGKRVLLHSFRTDQVAIFDLEEGKVVASTKSPSERLAHAAWSGDEKSVYLLCNDTDGGVYHWDPAQGASVQKLSEWPQAAYQVFPLPAEATGGAGQLLVIGSTLKPNPNPGPGSNQPLINDQPKASLFSLPDHKLIQTLPDYTNIRNRLSLSPDGSTVMGGLGSLYLLDVPALTTRFSMRAPSNLSCSSSTWAAGGRLIVAGYADGSLSILEAETGEPVSHLHIGLRSNCVSLSQDETWMLVSGFPLDMNNSKPEDMELLVIGLPDLRKAGSDRSFLAFAKHQLARLDSLDPELAALRAQADGPLNDLTAKYGAALKRTAATGTAQEQFAMNAEADAIANGKAVPPPPTDAATTGEHRRLRGIYRQQVAQLQAQRGPAGLAVSDALAGDIKKLGFRRLQDGDRLGSVRCTALLMSLGTPRPAPNLASMNASRPAPIGGSLPTPMPTPPATTQPMTSTPKETPIAGPSTTAADFIREVKIEVAIGRPTKTKGGDFDDKMQVMAPKIKLTNTSLKQAYDGYKAAFLLIGESAVDSKIIKVMQRQDFPVSIAARLLLEKELPEVTTQYDTTGAKFGFKYDGWVVQISGPGGEIIHTKSTFPSMEKTPDLIAQMKEGTCYDRKCKETEDPSFIRRRL